MQRLIHKLQQFLALPAAARRTFLPAMAMLPLIWIGLQRLQTWLQRKPLRVANPPPADELQRLGQRVNSTIHQTLGPANCLARSLYLWLLLCRRGIDCQLRTGYV